MVMDGVANKRHRLIDEEDRISAMQDSLIHLIFSFLEMKDVIKTSLLSRRWRNLWTTTPVLDFGYLQRPLDTTLINLSLMLYNGRKIQRFHAKFRCEVDSCYLDSWIRFLMMRDVEELDIQFFSKNYQLENENLYKLPFSIIDGGQFKVLILEFCVLSFPKSYCFRLLMKLHLSSVDFTDLDTSGCPILEVLILEGCSKNLNIHAPNQTLRYLKIHDYYNVVQKNCRLVLFAPNLLSIEFFGSLRRSYCMNLSSIKSAILGFDTMDEYDSVVASLVGLLNSLSSAKTLHLSEWSIQCLVYAEENYLKTLPLRATFLELETTLDEPELTVVLPSLLRNNHCLETLIVNICEALCYDDDISWEPLEVALSACLQLKTVIIRNFLGSWYCEHRLLLPKPNLNMDKFIESWPEELELIKFLLKSCKLLDKVIIRTVKMPDMPLKFELLLSVAKKLTAIPQGPCSC